MRHSWNKRKGNKDLNKKKIEGSERTCQQVYDTIIALQNRAKTKDIKQRLDALTELFNDDVEMEANYRYEDHYTQWTQKDRDNYIKSRQLGPISIRNIQRCIQKDNRIISNGLYHSVDEDSRFENRYLDPKGFGLALFEDVINVESFTSGRNSMLDLLTRFGAIVMYIFIEASKPFEDKKMTKWDRNDLAQYWAQNAVPLSRMFYAFTMIFNWKYYQNRVDPSVAIHDWYGPRDKPYNEMEQSDIDYCIKMLRSICPNIFDDLIKHRKKDAKN